MKAYGDPFSLRDHAGKTSAIYAITQRVQLPSPEGISDHGERESPATVFPLLRFRLIAAAAVYFRRAEPSRAEQSRAFLKNTRRVFVIGIYLLGHVGLGKNFNSPPYTASANETIRSCRPQAQVVKGSGTPRESGPIRFALSRRHATPINSRRNGPFPNSLPVYPPFIAECLHKSTDTRHGDNPGLFHRR